MEQVRLDKWLWAARFFKSRGLATEAVTGGRVHLNDVRVKPSKDVRVGDAVEVTIGEEQRTVLVTGVSDKRGPASVAATLYEETAESIAERERVAEQRRLAPRDAFGLGAGGGPRPTKRDRRRLDVTARRGRR